MTIRAAIHSILALATVLAVGAGTALAQGTFTGRWQVTAVNEGRALATLDLLHDERDTVTGVGRTAEGVLGRFGDISIEVTRGEAVDGGLGLRFSSTAEPTGESFSGRIFLNPPPPGAGGGSLRGSMVIANRAYNVEVTAIGGSTAAVAPHACTQLDRAAERLSARGEDQRRRVRTLLAEAGLDLGGRESADRCTAALAAITDLEGELDRQREETELASRPAAKGGSLASTTADGWITTLRDASRSLNVRSGPGVSTTAVGSLPGDAEGIAIIGRGCEPDLITADLARMPAEARLEAVKGKWCNIRWTGPDGEAVEGWVSGTYLTLPSTG